MKPGRRATAGFVLTAAGMLASRLGMRRNQPAPGPDAPPQEPRPATEGAHSTEEIERARAELSEELAKRAGE